MADIGLTRSLQEGGLSRKAAEDLVAALERRSRRRDADPWMLAYAALLTTLLVGGFAWTSSQINALDTKIGALDMKTGTLDSKTASQLSALDAKIDANAERLARLEVLLTERLPSQQ